MSDTTALRMTSAITVLAILGAPIGALWVQRIGDDKRAQRLRRETVFKTLWANRARPVWVTRVDALNMIEIEFHGERAVVAAWKELFGHYKFDYKAAGIAEAEQTRRHIEKYGKLLFEMSKVLGYDLQETSIRDDVYRPDIHGRFDEIEMETRSLTRDILQALKNMDALPMKIVKDEASTNKHLPL
ncbi:DUF6680 family protein [Acidicapsa acidisoli]|uniref:DUF6680 family protein n=1 Tax=Acidicapsa acidisoli TaxID=1615681 RepID=UPI0021E0FBA8|nr:DUF6680 family protein [Acidicapsa acidisoli]